MSDAAIRVEGLGKRYRLGRRGPYRTLRESLMSLFCRSNGGPSTDLWALKDVSFAVKPGEVVGVIGRNGAGKSTLLKILSRITDPTEGHAEVRGRVRALLEVGTGFHPELTGRENVYLNGAILGMKRAEIDRKFDDIAAFAEVEKFLDTPVKHYSSGMYTRLAFSVAAHLEPEILLVDEVLAVGDAAFQKKCLGKMGDFARSGRTVLFVSHNMAAIQHLCGSCLLLHEGRIVSLGPTEETISRYMSLSDRSDREDLRTRVHREGNGRLRCVRIEAAGLQTGSAGHIDIHYEGQPPLRTVQISLGLFTSMGSGTLFLANEILGKTWDELPAAGILRCSFPQLPLLPDRYQLNVYCTVNGELADWIVDAARVDVSEGDFYGTGRLPPPGYGSVLVPYQWEARG